MNILVLNAGSSSLKFCLYAMEGLSDLDEPERILASGKLERIGTPQAQLQLRIGDAEPQERPVDAHNMAHAAEQVIGMVTRAEGHEALIIGAIGHRVVHGGGRFYQPTRVDAEVIQAIRDMFELAPLHNPAGLAGIETGLRLLPNAPAVAVFDTGFHHELPPVTARYALPADLKARFPIRRYGMHGISYRYVSARLLHALGRESAGTRLVICHLGNGASVCALRDGRSVDTSMGFTPLEGLVMGTRSGDIDPGLLLYLIRSAGHSAAELEDLLNYRSGLLGLSGRSGDVRDLEQAAAGGDAAAEQALESFAYRVRKYIGAYAAALGGLDALAFTGGIGEHAAGMRERICTGLEFLGLALDRDGNRAASPAGPVAVSLPASRAGIWIVPTDEERQIARDTYTLLLSTRE